MQYFVKKVTKVNSYLFYYYSFTINEEALKCINHIISNGEALNLKGDKDSEELKDDCTSATGCVKRWQVCIKGR